MTKLARPRPRAKISRKLFQDCFKARQCQDLTSGNGCLLSDTTASTSATRTEMPPDQSGWMMFRARVVKQTLSSVVTQDGEHTTVTTLRTFQYCVAQFTILIAEVTVNVLMSLIQPTLETLC